MVMSSDVDSVLGPLRAADLGVTLMHEHLLVDTRTPAQKEASHLAEPLALHNHYLARRNDDHPHSLVLDSVSEAIDELRQFAAHGGATVVEVTPRCLGRNPAGLVDIARGAGVNIVMGGGFYDHHYHGELVHDRSIEELTERIVSDCLAGVATAMEGGAPVKAGVIGEMGLSWPAADCEHKALVAAARAQAATGKTLIIHPGRNADGPAWALEAAERAGADPSRVVLSHLDRTIDDADALAALARRGAFLSIDLFGSESSFYPYSDFAMPNDAGRLRLIRAVGDLGWLDRVLISHDIYAKAHLLRYGGEGYAHILRDVVPVMARFGIDESASRKILVENPARALTGHL
jgi:phosphotriesterase-related protein